MNSFHSCSFYYCTYVYVYHPSIHRHQCHIVFLASIECICSNLKLNGSIVIRTCSNTFSSDIHTITFESTVGDVRVRHPLFELVYMSLMRF